MGKVVPYAPRGAFMCEALVFSMHFWLILICQRWPKIALDFGLLMVFFTFLAFRSLNLATSVGIGTFEVGPKIGSGLLPSGLVFSMTFEIMEEVLN